MKIFNRLKNTGMLLVAASVLFTACNKLELDPKPTPPPANGTTPTLANLLDDPSFSLLKAAVNKAGLMTALANNAARYTVFAPDDAAITASLTPILPSGVTPAMYIASLTQAQAAGLIQYHVVPQVIRASSISTAFPNFQYPTILNPAPTVSPLLRLTTFPSVRPGTGAWVNNVPIIATNIEAVNGVVHKVFRIVMPPSTDLWATLNAASDLSYLRAAIARADSGVTRRQDSLVYALSTTMNPSAIGSNLTIFAPTDDAMKTFITGAIIQYLTGQGVPLAVAQIQASTLVNTFGTTILSNPASIPGVGGALASVITPTLAKGIVAYHVISSQSGTYAPPGLRVFSVNLPATASPVKTLLNTAVAVHPGLIVKGNFVSPAPGISVVASATVKGAANATASNVVGFDIHAVNGVVHKIDQVLLPQ